jgi:hypothetical protein
LISCGSLMYLVVAIATIMVPEEEPFNNEALGLIGG